MITRRTSYELIQLTDRNINIFWQNETKQNKNFVITTVEIVTDGGEFFFSSILCAKHI